MKANATQAELSATLAPVADRLLKQFKEAQAKLKAAKEAKDSTAEQLPPMSLTCWCFSSVTWAVTCTPLRFPLADIRLRQYRH